MALPPPLTAAGSTGRRRRGRRSPVAPSPLQVWAVEDTSLQLTWGALPPGGVVAETEHSGIEVEHRGGPGGLVLHGLVPASAQDVRVRWEGGEATLSTRTLAPPPGDVLGRVATVSDLHLGATRFGALRTMTERLGAEEHPHPWRCAVAAIDEARHWGADLLVVKGDVAHHQRAEDFAEAGALLDRFPDLEVLLLPGNHDVDGASDVPLPATLGQRGVPYVRGVAHRDLAGLRVIGADTTVPGKGPGRLSSVVDGVLDAARSAGGPVLVALHHQLQRRRVATHWPPGISGEEADRFLDQLEAANPQAMVTTGHSHRNRARRHGGIVITEVASTKDWPGVWAGYAIHEGGVRQVVRRTQAPDAIAWTEYSRAALLGLWDRWSPGTLHERCFTVAWSRS